VCVVATIVAIAVLGAAKLVIGAFCFGAGILTTAGGWYALMPQLAEVDAVEAVGAIGLCAARSHAVIFAIVEADAGMFASTFSGILARFAELLIAAGGTGAIFIAAKVGIITFAFDLT
jgi:hypothetical protein